MEHSDNSSKSTSAPQESSAPALPSRIDFALTITSLERRAVRARSRVLKAALTIFVLPMIFVGFIIFKVFSEAGGQARYTAIEAQFLTAKPQTSQEVNIASQRAEESERRRREGEKAAMLNAGTIEKVSAALSAQARELIGRIATDKTGMDGQAELMERAKSVETLLALLDHSTKIQTARASPKVDGQLEGIATTISIGLLSAGSVAVMLFIIQIGVSFMRYYARLAESYDAQAEALKASGGDPQLAYGFMQHMSPMSIDIGAAPQTLYEKALDTIKEVAGKKGASP